MPTNTEYSNLYKNFLKTHIKVSRPLCVVLDASNGTTALIIKDLFAGTPVQTTVINDTIDPNFSAHGPNPMLPGATDMCADMVKKQKADIGIIFDGDGDRAIFLDNEGKVIPACFVTTLLFKHSPPPYVSDELVYQSVRMLKVFPENAVIASRVGASFLKERMKSEHATCGAEYSGHYYFKEFFGVDSGIFAAITVLNVLSAMTEPLSQWQKSFGQHDIITVEIRTDGKDMPKIYEMLEKQYALETLSIDRRDGLSFIYKDFWINTRSSNTEPIMRIVAGGGGEIYEKVKEIKAFIEK